MKNFIPPRKNIFSYTQYGREESNECGRRKRDLHRVVGHGLEVQNLTIDHAISPCEGPISAFHTFVRFLTAVL